MQEMTGKCQRKAIYLYKIAGHRKIKVNHVGGLIETIKHHEIEAESGMTYYKSYPKYVFQEITSG